MKIAKKHLQQIIKEEIASIIRERQSFTDDELRDLALKRGFKPDTDPSDSGDRREAEAEHQIRKWAEKEGLVEPQGPSSATLTDRKVRAIRDQAMKLEKSGNWRGALNLLDKGIKEVGNVFGTPLIKLQKELRAEYATQAQLAEEELEESDGPRSPEYWRWKKQQDKLEKDRQPRQVGSVGSGATVSPQRGPRPAPRGGSPRGWQGKY